MEIPCKNCIVFAICKAKLSEQYKIKKGGYVGWTILRSSCSLFYDFIYESSHSSILRNKIAVVEDSLYEVYGKVFGPSISFIRRNGDVE